MVTKQCVVVPVGWVSTRVVSNLRKIAAHAASANRAVVVVDDTATGSPQLQDGHWQYLRCGVRNSYVARNIAIDYAVRKGTESLLFVDSDCVVDEGWPEHLTSHLAEADVVTGYSPPSGTSRLAMAAALDYQVRLEEWAGAPIGECGVRFSTLDTRAAAARVSVFEDGYRFNEALRNAGDAELGRRLVRAGYKVVGCGEPFIRHEAPSRWRAEWLKYVRTAQNCTHDLRRLPRAHVLSLLPEHAHCLLQPSLRKVSVALWTAVLAAGSASLTSSGAKDLEAYRRLRESAWQIGWYIASRKGNG